MSGRSALLGGLLGLAIGGGTLALKVWLTPAPECFVTTETVDFGGTGHLFDSGVQIVMQAGTRGHTRVVLEGVAMERCAATDQDPLALGSVGR